MSGLVPTVKAIGGSVNQTFMFQVLWDPPFAVTDEDRLSYFDASVMRIAKYGGMPVLLVNAPAFDVTMTSKCVIGGGETSANTVGVALNLGHIQNILAEARVAKLRISPASHRRDQALVRIGVAIDEAIRMRGFTGALPCVQWGDRLPVKQRMITLREEVDHARQIACADSRDFLPVSFFHQPLAQKAGAALAGLGYRIPLRGPFADYNRMLMGMEIGVRLMRRGRFVELGLSIDEARELARHYTSALFATHSDRARLVIYQTCRAINVAPPWCCSERAAA